ncbi:hypothetical protein FGO68_gene14192 [Halteria grandinella]|uniref:Uncharacterized protein n=1 Tax=Halteria grandinella TaxID=5974 RepID=A0A8J8NMJ4_HALGN|nr:hypothetical protein FGO68_gene14192 [Halteria grandinella]
MPEDLKRNLRDVHLPANDMSERMNPVEGKLDKVEVRLYCMENRLAIVENVQIKVKGEGNQLNREPNLS